ncbi:hypothetical protein M885DRAFT_612873 [Pelagophyceae sp. CCMP2097]|nr:hypothetical protein M885DRAFT_612873 [Pelagophyceae sp. CCMP2097]
MAAFVDELNVRRYSFFLTSFAGALRRARALRRRGTRRPGGRRKRARRERRRTASRRRRTFRSGTLPSRRRRCRRRRRPRAKGSGRSRRRRRRATRWTFRAYGRRATFPRPTSPRPRSQTRRGERGRRAASRGAHAKRGRPWRAPRLLQPARPGTPLFSTRRTSYYTSVEGTVPKPSRFRSSRPHRRPSR